MRNVITKKGTVAKWASEFCEAIPEPASDGKRRFRLHHYNGTGKHAKLSDTDGENFMTLVRFFKIRGEIVRRNDAPRGGRLGFYYQFRDARSERAFVDKCKSLVRAES